jgi:hypothetical protein
MISLGKVGTSKLARTLYLLLTVTYTNVAERLTLRESGGTRALTEAGSRELAFLRAPRDANGSCDWGLDVERITCAMLAPSTRRASGARFAPGLIRGEDRRLGDERASAEFSRAALSVDP